MPNDINQEIDEQKSFAIKALKSLGKEFNLARQAARLEQPPGEMDKHERVVSALYHTAMDNYRKGEMSLKEALIELAESLTAYANKTPTFTEEDEEDARALMDEFKGIAAPKEKAAINKGEKGGNKLPKTNRPQFRRMAPPV